MGRKWRSEVDGGLLDREWIYGAYVLWRAWRVLRFGWSADGVHVVPKVGEDLSPTGVEIWVEVSIAKKSFGLDPSIVLMWAKCNLEGSGVQVEHKERCRVMVQRDDWSFGCAIHSSCQSIHICKHSSKSFGRPLVPDISNRIPKVKNMSSTPGICIANETDLLTNKGNPNEVLRP